MSIDWIPTGAKRKITAKEQGNRGLFPSIKVFGGLVEYESCLERDCFLVLNHCPTVRTFQHQPVTISFIDKNNKSRKYTPDVYVEYTNGFKVLYEIKYEDDVRNNKQKYKDRWEAAKIWAKKNGMTFKVITEIDIRTPRRENVWFTLGSSKCSENDKYTDKITPLIPNEGVQYNQFCYIISEEFGIPIINLPMLENQAVMMVDIRYISGRVAPYPHKFLVLTPYKFLLQEELAGHSVGKIPCNRLHDSISFSYVLEDYHEVCLILEEWFGICEDVYELIEVFIIVRDVSEVIFGFTV